MRRLIWAAILAVTTVGATPAGAHPHAWIDIRSTVVFDGQGRVVALDLEWLFDAFYTVFILEDIAQKGDPPQEALIELARTNLSNLREYDYFLEVRTHGLKRAIGAVETFETGVKDDRLWMTFRVPFEEAVDAASEDLTYAVFDPTYYIEILHAEDDPVSLDGAPLGACSARIEEPAPDEETVSLAAMLAQDEIGPGNLGRLFAQTVRVTCE